MGNPWTPGPWSMESKEERDFIASDCDGVRSGWVRIRADGVTVAASYMRSEDQNEANARLIAEAPAMADFAEKVAEYFTMAGEPHWLGEEARAILARIRGEVG